MKTYKKCDFSQAKLLEMKAGDSILVQCNGPEEFSSVRQTCYNAPERKPRDGITRYSTSIDKENKLVLILAEK